MSPRAVLEGLMWRAGFRIELPCSGTLSMRLTRRGPKERICLYKMQSRSQARLRNVLNRRISARKHSEVMRGREGSKPGSYKMKQKEQHGSPQLKTVSITG